MRQKLKLIGICLFSVYIPITFAIQCRSYGRNLGECVLITRCPPLLAILLSSERTNQDLRMLQKLTCVTEISELEKDPVVCCAVKDIQSVSDFLDSVPTNTRPTRPTPIQSPPTQTTTTTPLAPRQSTSATVPDQLVKSKFPLFPPLKECSNSLVVDRIIGGVSVPHGAYPWMARLGYKHKGTGRLEYYCGGSIINSRYILTAGHCTQGFDENFILDEVRLGEHDATTDVDCNHELGATAACSVPSDYKIEKIITHPQHNTVTKHNDIAILRVNQNISFSGSYFVKPVCLPFLKEYEMTLPDDFDTRDGIVAGWGRQNWNVTQGSSVLMEVSIPLVPNSKCHNLYRRRVHITPKQMCAGAVQGKDSCSGDSGGPLMVNVPLPSRFQKSFQFGIVSFGQIQCGGSLPGVYTRISEYLPWILENVEP